MQAEKNRQHKSTICCVRPGGKPPGGGKVLDWFCICLVFILYVQAWLFVHGTFLVSLIHWQTLFWEGRVIYKHFVFFVPAQVVPTNSFLPHNCFFEPPRTAKPLGSCFHRRPERQRWPAALRQLVVAALRVGDRDEWCRPWRAAARCLSGGIGWIQSAAV